MTPLRATRIREQLVYWRDLAEVAGTPRIAAAVRSRAESLLRDGLGDMRLGDRVTLARLATPALLPLLLADSEREVTEASLQNARLREEDLVNALRRADVLPVLIEAVAGVSPWSERPRLLARVVLNPRAPRALAQRLVGALYWRDLAEVAATPRLAAAVRARAESQLRDGLPDMRLGDRVTLARLATPPLLPLLLADSEPQVTQAALVNPRLREDDLVTVLRRENVRAALVEAVAASQRWKASYAVQLALVLQPRTPLPLALPRISSLVPRDLRRVAEDAALRPLVRAAAREVLEHASGGTGGAQPPESQSFSSNSRRLNEMHLTPREREQ